MKESPIERILRWRKLNPTEYVSKKNAALSSSEKVKAAARMVSIKYKKERMASRARNPRSAKGEANAVALVWRLRDPRGKIYEFRNLAHFIRNNEHLFETYETRWIWRGNGLNCLAYSGLAALRPYRQNGLPRKRVEGSWKGWMWNTGSPSEVFSENAQ